ncbi:MAG: CinA family protein [Alphaproteobacteria bacterium TMED194]|nr:MAG: CinA family protein [Alphaproteobacteria bacterium TMED194]
MENFSKKLIKYCIDKKLSMSIAESCTGGMIVSKLISVPDASKVIDCGLVTYSNKAKQIYLAVPKFELEKYGAVSKQVAELMIDGLKKKNSSDIFISTTGIAGPGGGSKKKPVGTVYHSFYFKNKNILTIKNFYEGSRFKIRLSASMFSINETFKRLNSIM